MLFHQFWNRMKTILLLAMHFQNKLYITAKYFIQKWISKSLYEESKDFQNFSMRDFIGWTLSGLLLRKSKIKTVKVRKKAKVFLESVTKMVFYVRCTVCTPSNSDVESVTLPLLDSISEFSIYHDWIEIFLMCSPYFSKISRMVEPFSKIHKTPLQRSLIFEKGVLTNGSSLNPV